jgi:hypothetical protein
MTDPISPTPAEQALDDVAAMLAPLVRWLLVQGIPLNALVRTLRGVYLSEAHGDLERRGRRVTDSALSVLTGIHRKEVRAYMEAHHEPTGLPTSPPRLAPTPAATLFTQWITDPDYRLSPEEVRRELPRHGPAPSFEALAREASRDVHPRTLLEELERLELVEVRPEQVRLLSDRFVPPVHDPDAVRTMAVNVADHIAAAVNNLRADDPARIGGASGRSGPCALGCRAARHGARGSGTHRNGRRTWFASDIRSFHGSQHPRPLRDLLPSRSEQIEHYVEN